MNLCSMKNISLPLISCLPKCKPKLPPPFLPQYMQVIPYLLYTYITIRILIKRKRKMFIKHEIVHAVPVRYVIDFIMKS